MTIRVSSKNKGNRLKGKIALKKKDRKNGATSKQKIASPGVEPGLSAPVNNSLTTAPQ